MLVLSSAAHLVTTPPAWTNPDGVTECPVERRLVGEAGLQRDLNERVGACQHQILRHLDPALN